MIKITNEQNDHQPYLACDLCGDPVYNGDVCAWQVDAAGQPISDSVKILHARCYDLTQATGKGTYQAESIRTITTNLARGLFHMPPEVRRRERRQRLILKVIAAAHGRPVSVRQIQRTGNEYTAAELREHLDWLVEMWVLDPVPSPRGTRYVRGPKTIEEAEQDLLRAVLQSDD